MSAVSNLLSFIGQKFKRNLFGPLGSFVGNVNELANIATGKGTGNSTVDSWLHTMTGDAPNGLQLWTAGREDTAYQRAVKDMSSAGLNPALMYGSGGPSVSSAGNQSPTGISDLLQLAMLPLQMESLKADIAYKKAETQGKIIQNEGESKRNTWIDIMNTAKLRSENARASLDEETISEVRQRIEESKASTARQIEEAKTEERKRDLMSSQILLNNANAENIEAVRPYQIALLESETEAEYAEASWKMIQTAREKRLIDGGYIESVIKAMKADCTVKEVEAYLSSDTYGEPENNVVSRVARKIVVGVNNAIRVISPIKSKF